MKSEEKILDISKSDIKALETQQLLGELSYLSDLKGIECYCESDQD